MSSKYAAVLRRETSLPERELLIGQAWGDVPVSYVQDQECLNDCSFLDLKINKWEVNPNWSGRQDSDVWIRIEILKEARLVEYLQNEVCPLSVDVDHEILVVFELDEGWSAFDNLLLLRLVSAFCDFSKIYKWCGIFQELSSGVFSCLPSKNDICERLQKGE
jgi:hypothetical protein